MPYPCLDKTVETVHSPHQYLQLQIFFPKKKRKKKDNGFSDDRCSGSALLLQFLNFSETIKIEAQQQYEGNKNLLPKVQFNLLLQCWKRL